MNREKARQGARQVIAGCVHSFLIIALLLTWLQFAAAKQGAGHDGRSRQLQVNFIVAIQSAQDVRALVPGKPIERELDGGKSHLYQITLAAGQYLHVVVDQRGIDVVATLFGPDGQKLDEVDSPNGTQGLEPVYLVAEASGNYQLEVRPLERNAAAGRYEVKIEELREATAKDRTRIAARRAFSEGKNLRSKGTAESLRKSFEKFEEALSLFRAVGDSGGEAITLTDMGSAYRQSGEKQRALEYYLQSLPRWREAGNQGGEAIALNYIGMLYNDLGKKQEALDYYHQALRRFRAVRGRGGEAEALFNIARYEKERGDLVAARSYSEAVIKVSESLRANLGSEAVSIIYFIRVEEFYEFYIDLLMQLSKQEPSARHDAEALQASERARARSLLELLAEAGADLRQGVDPVLLKHERTLQQLLNAKAESQTRLLSGTHTKEQTAEAEKEIEVLADEYWQVQAQIRAKSPRYAALTQQQPLSLQEIQTEALDQDTLLLEYALGENRSYLWAVTPTSLNSFVLPRRVEIEAAARRVYELLTARNRRVDGETAEGRRARVAQADAAYPASAAALSRVLLGPISSQLGKKRLLIVGDGMLQFVPFAALPTPAGAIGARAGAKTPLIAEHEIVSLPSASALAVLRRELAGREPAPKTVAVLADPVFDKDDERVLANNAGKRASRPSGGAAEPAFLREVVRAMEDVNDSSQRLPRLYNTRAEAEVIRSLVPPRESLQALDFAANRATATSASLSQYRILHFATHAIIDSTHPELSGIVLSLVNEQGEPQDGFLRAHEIFNLKLPAELVVLSACRTGLGKEVKGEGLVGMTRGFMYAGAPRVVVSLWSLDDRATAELMARFYRKMLGAERLTPAAALRSAQVEMWRSKRWGQPYFWAAAVLQGEWK